MNISYLINKLQGGAYWLYNATLHPNHGVVGSFLAGLLDWCCAHLSSTQAVQSRFASQDQLRFFIIFCAASLLLLGVLCFKIATRKKAKTGLTRSYSYNA